VLSLIGILRAGWFVPSWYLRAELLAKDFQASLHRSSFIPNNSIVIVDIDDVSIDAVAGWPWPREAIVYLVLSLLDTYNAKAVALDIVFPDATGSVGDSDLASLGRTRPVIFSQVFDLSTEGKSLSIGTLGGSLTSKPFASEFAPVASGFVGNHQGLSSSPCIGHISPQPDPDGLLRRIPPLVNYGGNLYPMLALAMLECPLIADPRPDIDLSRLYAWVARQGYMHVTYQSGLRGYTVLPAVDVIAGNANKELIDGRYVLIGSSAMGLGDRVATPIHPWMPGVLVHAEVLSELLQAEGRVKEKYDFPWLDWVWASAWIIIYAVVAALCRARIVLLVVLTSCVAWMFIADHLLFQKHDVQVLLPLISAIFFLLIQVPFEWARAENFASNLQKRMNYFLPREALFSEQQIGERTDLVPKETPVTVLFVDILGYTSIAEKSELQQLVSFTEWVLESLTAEVNKRGGTLDKYMGDALMAFWHAGDSALNAQNAVTAGLQMLEAIERMNIKVSEKFSNVGSIKLSIGIASGEAIIGELGTSVRRSYTALGDPVNLASRLQVEAKSSPYAMLVCGVTAKLAPFSNLAPLGEFQIRGRERAEKVFGAGVFRTT
jgi:adenylate cyclase